MYAAHTAGKMGLPINKIYVATNSNDIMHRTISNGDMSLKDVKSTISPSMDIQISSNFERQLFESLEYNSDELSNLMKLFIKNKEYDVKGKIHDNLKLYYKSKGIDDEQIRLFLKILFIVALCLLVATSTKGRFTSP